MLKNRELKKDLVFELRNLRLETFKYRACSQYKIFYLLVTISQRFYQLSIGLPFRSRRRRRLSISQLKFHGNRKRERTHLI